MRLTRRVDKFQQRHPSWGFPIAVAYKFFDDQGNYLAALITFYGVLSLVPLLLLLNTILQLVLHGDPTLRAKVLDSALSQFPFIGDQQASDQGVRGSGLRLIVGVVGTVYGALGVGTALQNAMNVLWAVPRNSRPNPFALRGRSIILIGVLGVSVIGTTVLSGLSSSVTPSGPELATGLKWLTLAISVVVNAGVFLLAFKIATAAPVRWRDIAPGALLSAVAWQVLQSFGALYVAHVVKNADALNGVFALLLGLIVWIYLEAMAVVFAAEINAVRARRLYPRALLTPFTDDVDLTSADRRAYIGSAQAQRAKGFEDIAVTFRPPPAEKSD